MNTTKILISMEKINNLPFKLSASSPLRVMQLNYFSLVTAVGLVSLAMFTYLQLNYFTSILFVLLLSFKSLRSSNFHTVQRRQLRKSDEYVISITRII